MGYDVDFLNIGEKSNSGDAILLHFGEEEDTSQWKVVLIDGGFSSDGERIINKIDEYYSKNKIDLIISTHPDQDHINGLHYILENIDVGELWIHKPWEHNKIVLENLQDGRHTENSIEEKLKESVSKAYDLVKMAESKGIKVTEPFHGLSLFNNKLTILGPSEEYYESLIPEFDGMPGRTQKSGTIAKALSNTIKEAFQSISQIWGDDGLPSDDETSAKNNSSVITQLIIDNRRIILTGDAGITALNQAVDQLDTCLNPAEIYFLQIPHHGSKRNISSELLDRLIGEHISEGQSQTSKITTFASVAKEGAPKHPSIRVLNAITSRGAKAIITQGSPKRHYHKSPEREGWSIAESHQFQYSYEE